MNYKNRELPILTYFKKKAILRKNMTAFRILSILKYIYAYFFQFMLDILAEIKLLNNLHFPMRYH